MQFLKQFWIILILSFLGELLHALIPWPIPGSIYGMILLFAALMLGVIRLEQVQETGHFLLNIMTVLFVCPVVGLLKCWDIVQENWIAVLVITVVSLILTFAVSGRVTQRLLKGAKIHG